MRFSRCCEVLTLRVDDASHIALQRLHVFLLLERGQPKGAVACACKEGGSNCEILIEPQVGVAESYGLSSPELNELAKVIADNRPLIERIWHEFFGKDSEF